MNLYWIRVSPKSKDQRPSKKERAPGQTHRAGAQGMQRPRPEQCCQRPRKFKADWES